MRHLIRVRQIYTCAMREYMRHEGNKSTNIFCIAFTNSRIAASVNDRLKTITSKWLFEKNIKKNKKIQNNKLQIIF